MQAQPARVRGGDLEADLQPVGGGPGGQALGPLDGGHGLAGEHVGQPEVVQVRARVKPVEIQVEEGQAGRVFVDEREARAGDVSPGGDAQPAGQPLDEGRLAAAEVAFQEGLARVERFESSLVCAKTAGGHTRHH